MVVIELALFSLTFTVILCFRCYIYDKDNVICCDYLQDKQKILDNQHNNNYKNQQLQQLIKRRMMNNTVKCCQIIRRRVSYCYLDSKTEIHDLRECLLTYKFPTTPSINRNII